MFVHQWGLVDFEAIFQLNVVTSRRFSAYLKAGVVDSLLQTAARWKL